MSGVNAYIAGWGRDGWGAGPWSQSTVGSATGSTNAVTVVAEANAPVTGLAATGAVNGVTVVAEANLNVTGVEGTLSIPNRGGPTFTAEGDAQLSTAQKKFGTASLLLDGAGDYVKSGPSDVTSGNFTVEFFVYTDDILQDAHLWDNQVSNSGFALAITSLGKIRIIKDNVIQGTYNSGMSNDTWHHVALVGNGNVLTVFVDGFPKGQKNIFSGIGTYSDQPYYIGARHNETQFFNGYIDEFRASNTPRYSGIFTPTTSAFSIDSNTLELVHFDGTNGSKKIVNETQGLTVEATAEVSITGLGATSGLGSVDIEGNANVPTTGIVATSGVGSVTATGVGNVTVTGEEATGAVGTVDVDAAANVEIFTPFDSMFGQVGTATPGISVDTLTTGLSASLNVGNVTVKANADAIVTGFALQGKVGNVRTTNQIVPVQNPVYTNPNSAAPDAPLSAPSYTDPGGVIRPGAPLSSPGYKEVA